jgi:hypothetical protein
MKPIRSMTQGELAAFVHQHLKENGIDVVLSGGAVVSIYSENRYVSHDIDLILRKSTSYKQLKEVMEEIGFTSQNRHFEHPDSQFFVEFPTGPLAVGKEQVKQINEIEYSTGTLRLLSPTDCVKDRLATYYYFNDRQGLEQAAMVAESHAIDVEAIKSWIDAEGKDFAEFQKFLS